jgi:cAMP-dependent protein kinase regulator
MKKKSKNTPKPKPRLPPDEIIVSDDEDYNDPEEIDQNLDNPEFIQKCNNDNRRIAVTENCSTEDDDIPIKTYKKNNELIEFMRINLMKSPIFSELSLDVLRKCIDAMEEKNVPAVTDVVKQGEIGDNFFFLAEGELECKIQFTKITKEGNRKKIEKFEPKLVKIYGPGDYFGELSLLYHTPRRGTIKTVNDAKLFTLNRSTYKKILRKANNEEILRRINIFKKVPILETLTDDEFEKLEEISKDATYYNGETIIKENEYSNIMFIIDKGRCVGTQTTENGKLPMKSRDYREGDIIGEGALLKPERRQENIIANSDIVKFICLDRFSFKHNFGSLEQILMRNMDLYYTFFPPIEEKPEEKNENNKEDNDRSNDKSNTLLVSQAQSPNQNNQHNNNSAEQQGKQPENNNVNNNSNNNPNTNAANIEEITKKIKKEAEEEKKKIEMKHEEEIEKLKKELANLLNKNQELQKINEEKEQIIQNNQNIDQNNIDENNINNKEPNNQNIDNNNNKEVNNNGIQFEQEQIQQGDNIENKEMLNNNNINNGEEQINNNNEINNNDVNQNDANNANQNEEKKEEEQKNKEESASKNSSQIQLMRDKLEYQENENINNNNNIDNKEEGKENAGIPDFLKDDAFENHEGGFVEK